MMIVIGIAVILLVLLIVLSACRMAAIADRDMEMEYARWLEEHPEKRASE